jgi:hypothetical protein
MEKGWKGLAKGHKNKFEVCEVIFFILSFFVAVIFNYNLNYLFRFSSAHHPLGDIAEFRLYMLKKFTVALIPAPSITQHRQLLIFKF